MEARVLARDPADLERELERRVEGRLRLSIRAAVAEEVRWAMNGGSEKTEGLTRRELQMLQALADRMAVKQVARTFRISDKTVRNHLTAVFGKLGVSSSPAAVAEGFRRGILS